MQGENTHDRQKLQTGQKSAQCNKAHVCASPVHNQRAQLTQLLSIISANLMRRNHTNRWALIQVWFWFTAQAELGVIRKGPLRFWSSSVPPSHHRSGSLGQNSWWTSITFGSIFHYPPWTCSSCFDVVGCPIFVQPEPVPLRCGDIVLPWWSLQPSVEAQVTVRTLLGHWSLN